MAEYVDDSERLEKDMMEGKFRQIKTQMNEITTEMKKNVRGIRTDMLRRLNDEMEYNKKQLERMKNSFYVDIDTVMGDFTRIRKKLTKLRNSMIEEEEEEKNEFLDISTKFC